MSPGEVEILMVEDDPRDAELILRALKDRDPASRVHRVKDGAEAVDFLFGNAPVLPKFILLDLKLVGMDGLEVLGRIKSEERTRAVPVVVLSSSAEERDVSESYRRGANSYIVKPVDSDEFLAALAELSTYWLVLNRQPS